MGFRLVTFNLNGIRSAASKGFVQWPEKAGDDCMGVQEIEAQHADVAGRFERIGSLQRPLTPGVTAKARRESIYVDRRFSNHAPLTIDCDFAL